ncbi:hypothetical protein [Methylobacterium sp. WL120]|uniref:hypothetical protein n=1 Tax=Methylobacterium sp. WL120 TaxID=2603887 RepID=UPI0011CA38CA|nr:hypothetical protein [Methylobacterium sp. WL120]TXM64607.1 hypothetical protein FV229_18110 [Methylobacterium sp. WL120]
MNHREHTAYRLGADLVTTMALAVAARIKTEPGLAEEERDAARAALLDLVARTTLLEPLQARRSEPRSVSQARALVADAPGDEGTLPCPLCGVKLDWIRVGEMTTAFCETEGCVAWVR